MKYRKFGRLDREVSVLGLGTARLPLNDEAVITGIVRRAVDGGVNYLDLGQSYDPADCEKRARLVGKALGGGRSRVMLAAGLPVSLIGSAADLDGHLRKLLDWLGTDRLDFFLPGGLDRYTWPRLRELEVLPVLEKAIAEGCLGAIGFAFHDIFQYLREIIEAYNHWSLVRFQYSYMDIDHHPGTGGLGYAASAGLGVVVAEPLKGGRLTRRARGPAAKVWSSSPRDWSQAAWGLRWAWDNPGVSTVVTNVGSMEELEEDLAVADLAVPGSITVEEEIFLGRLRDAYRSLRPVPCTACRGCMPCPLGIDAPRIFELYNDAVIYEDVATMRNIYTNERHHIEDCNGCGTCAMACGFEIDIPGFLKQAQTLLDDSG